MKHPVEPTAIITAATVETETAWPVKVNMFKSVKERG